MRLHGFREEVLLAVNKASECKSFWGQFSFCFCSCLTAIVVLSAASSFTTQLIVNFDYILLTAFSSFDWNLLQGNRQVIPGLSKFLFLYESGWNRLSSSLCPINPEFFTESVRCILFRCPSWCLEPCHVSTQHEKWRPCICVGRQGGSALWFTAPVCRKFTRSVLPAANLCPSRVVKPFLSRRQRFKSILYAIQLELSNVWLTKPSCIQQIWWLVIKTAALFCQEFGIISVCPWCVLRR